MSSKKSFSKNKAHAKKNEKIVEDSKDAEFGLNFSSTKEIFVPKSLIEQVIGQDKSVEIIKKAAAQKRNVLLVGVPGTGKSLLAQAMSEILPVGNLVDVLMYPNEDDSNNPKVRVIKSGDGKKILNAEKLEYRKAEDSSRMISFFIPIIWMFLGWLFWQWKWYSDIIFAALLLIGAFLLIGLALGGQMRTKEGATSPKLLINNEGKKVAPFFEATGSRAGALLGDVRHDPLQCFYGFNELYLLKEGRESPKFVKKPLNVLWDEMFSKYKMEIIRNEKGHEAIMLPTKEKVFTLGYKDGKVVLSRVLSLNRQPYDGHLVEISADKNKVIVTPEHKIITKKGDKPAGNVSEIDSLFNLSSTTA
jgi:Lon-like ATP-dependent protease